MDGGWDVYLGHSLQLVLGIVLLLASVTKLRHPGRFVTAVKGYEVVPAAVAPPLAVGVLGAEALVGLALLSNRGVVVAAPAAAGLFAAFAVAVAVDLRRGSSVPCGCFGADDERVSPRTLARLGLLLGAAVTLVVLRVAYGEVAFDVAELADEGRAGVERLVAVVAIGAFLTATAIWLLHLPEVVGLVHDIRHDRRDRERN